MEKVLLEQIYKHFIAAIKNGEYELVKFFVEKFSEIDINLPSFCGKTPLHWAVFKKKTNIALFLLDRPDINYNALDELETTPLAWACSLNQIEVVVALLKKENLDFHTKDIHGKTALMYAVSLGNLEIANMLLDVFDDGELCAQEDYQLILKLALNRNYLDLAEKIKSHIHQCFF